MHTLPNYLTLLRVLLLPVFVTLFLLPWQYGKLAAAMVFALVAITDYFDGYLARKLNQSSRFGAFLDPVADKLTVAAALVVIVGYYQSLWVTIPAIIIVSREILVSALREWMAELGARGKVAVSWLGKWKTTAQMAAIGGLLSALNPVIINISLGLLLIAAALTIWSMLDYLRAAWPQLTKYE